MKLLDKQLGIKRCSCGGVFKRNGWGKKADCNRCGKVIDVEWL